MIAVYALLATFALWLGVWADHHRMLAALAAAALILFAVGVIRLMREFSPRPRYARWEPRRPRPRWCPACGWAAA